MNDQWGRALREWILFAVGITMIMAGASKTLVTGDSPPETFWGVALIIAGVGNEILRRAGGDR